MILTLLDFLKELEITTKNNFDFSEEVKKYRNLFLILLLDNEVYAIPAEKTEELIPLEHLIVTGDGPDFRKGLICYNGTIIEAIDLRLRLNKKSKAYDDKNTVVVISKNYKLFGLIVDDVIDYSFKTIENSGLNQNADYFIKSLIEGGDKEKIKLLDVDNILNFDQFHLMSWEVVK